jgi:hypothetical protein
MNSLCITKKESKQFVISNKEKELKERKLDKTNYIGTNYS